jgi:hypothetical protein
MIILLALALFLIVKLFLRVIAVSRRHSGVARRAQVKRRTTARGPSVADDLDQPVSAWTVLDDLQLNRLLKDSAPRPNS